MKENLVELAPVEIELLRKEMLDSEPLVEVLGNIKEFSQTKRWFRDTTPIPDIG